MERRTLLKRRLLRRKKRRYTQLLNQLRAELRAAYLATVAASSPANPIAAVAKEARLLHGSPKPPTSPSSAPPHLTAFLKSHPLVATDVIPTLLFKHVNPPPSVFASKRRQPRDDIITGVKGDGPKTPRAAAATNGQPKGQLEATLRLLEPKAKPKTSPKPPKKYSEKMKAEASILQRISELQKEGLWSDKRLPKVREPDRKKSHWDYVLEEAAWMQMDFHQERKWKQAASKRISRAVQRHFAQKELAVEREKREEEIKKRRVASSIARDVNRFWSNVKKVVELRELSRIEDLRKSALDEQLSFIVDQTEKYSGLLAKKFKRAGGEAETPTPPPPPPPPPTQPLSDGEFELGSASSGDDEETIERAEVGLAAEEVSAEVDLLQKESQMELDDILNELPAGYISALRSPEKEATKVVVGAKEEKGGRALVEELVSPHEVSLGDDADFSPPSDVESDNEATLAAEEAREGKVDHEEEVLQLELENEMSVEELFKLHYGGVREEDLAALQELEGGGGSETPTEEEEEDDEDEEEEEEEESSGEESEGSDQKEKAQDSELASLLKSFAPGKGEGEGGGVEGEEGEEGELGSVAALAESFQPKGSTYSSTQVVTSVPPLIKHTLREYQHIGLDWLVAMYEKRLNGILADEMGLGKTIQTISLLAYLAYEKGEWGPHLIVVPTSVMLNWEMEFKKWAPGLKLLTYYGSQKERKAKRHGWTKHNSFHVCITSYKLVIQDHQSFRRKRWTYFILDEAQNIKNFKSQRWQLLLNFNSSRRLLLTGTPLQNNLMELWSLMHFLMPNVFQSHREFREWFSNPVSGMVEGNAEYNENIIRRLHKVLRPFILRRLKSEVEKQLPSKYEHLVLCKLSKRQRFLYEEFMSRSRTKETLNSGNLLSVINVLMQLRKVCNHPNLFEPRPVISPFHADGIHLTVPSLVWNIHETLSYHKPSYPLFQLTEEDASPSGLSKEEAWRVQSMTPGWNSAMGDASSLHASPARLALRSDSSAAKWYDMSTVKFFRGRSVFGSSKEGGGGVGGPPPAKKPRLGLAEEVGTILERLKEAPPPMPVRPFPMHLFLTTHDPDKAGLFDDSEFMTYVNKRFNVEAHPPPIQSPPPVVPPAPVAAPPPPPPPPPPQPTPAPPTLLLSSSSSSRRKESLLMRNGVRARGLSDPPEPLRSLANRRRRSVVRSLALEEEAKKARLMMSEEAAAFDLDAVGDVDEEEEEEEEVIVRSRKGRPKPLSGTLGVRRLGINPLEFQLPEIQRRALSNRGAVLKRLERLNNLRCERSPVYGRGLYESVGVVPWVGVKLKGGRRGAAAAGGLAGLFETLASKVDGLWRGPPCWSEAVLTLEERLESLRPVLSRFVIYVPPVASPAPLPTVFHPAPSAYARHKGVVATLASSLNTSLLHPIVSSMATQFPDPRLIQYDCGKLQRLQLLLRELKAGSHRVLIFTQMAKMLDVLEAFLNYHGHIYLRLDGATKIDQRQLLMERFNTDKRIFCFILSTRSGGIGVNLTGADTVIFYDSDWNPTMDAQAQDRCHRIGQTRDVHIYRLVCEKTVEENILKKSNQKRMLGELAIEGGNFTTAFFTKSTIHDLFKTEGGSVLEEDSKKRLQQLGFNLPATAAAAPVKEAEEEEVKSGDATQMFESALLAAEDEMDAKAARNVRAEADAELAEFDETIDLDELDGGGVKKRGGGEKRNEIDDIFEQLNGVELYAVRMMEETLEDWSTETYAAAQKDIEKQKQEWEDAQLRTLQQLEEEKEAEEEEDVTLTYAANSNKVWVAQRPEITNMPIWNPPTPPTDDADVLMPVDSCYAFLYCNELMPESQLPSVFAHKVSRKVEMSSKPLPSLLQPEFDVSETDDGSFSSPCKKSSPSKLQRRDEPIFAPRSLFDRPSPALAKLRRDFKVQKHNNRTVGPPQKQTLGPGAISFPIISPNSAKAPPTPPADMIEWLIHEDFELLKVVQQLLELPSSLLVVNLAQTPNWDLASEVVSMSSRTFRTAKQCKWRYENIVGPREEGKLFYESPLSPNSSPTSKKKKSQKTFIKITPPSPSKASRYLKTSQLMTQDNNAQVANFYTSKFDVIKAIANKRAPTSKPMTVTPSVKLNKQAGIFSEYGINYDSPMPATAIAQSRQERLQQERKRIIAQHQQSLQASGLLAASPAAPQPGSPVAVTQGQQATTPSTPPTPDKPPVMRGYVPAGAAAASSLLEAQKRAQAQAQANAAAAQQKPLRPQEFIVLQKAAQQSAAPTTPPTIQMVSPKPPLLIHHQTLVALSQASPTHIVTSTSSTASKTPTLQRTLTMQDLVSSASQSPSSQAPQTLVSLTPVTKVLGSATPGATTFVQTSAAGTRLATLGPATPSGQQLQSKPTGAPMQVQYIRQGNVIRSQPVISTASQQVAAAGGKEGIKRIQVVSSSAPLPMSIASSSGGAIFTQATTPASGITASALTQQKQGVPVMTLSSAQSALGQLGQGRPVQLVKQQTIGGKTVTRTVTEAEIATLLKQHGLTPASPTRSLPSATNTVVVSSGGKGATPATPFSTTTILTSMGIQNLIRAPGTTSGGQITTYVKSQAGTATPQTQGGTLTIPVPLSTIKTIGATLNKGSPRVSGPPAQHHYVVHTSGRVGATAGKNIYLPANQLTPRFQTQVIRSVDFTRPMQLGPQSATAETWRGGRLPSIRPVETSSAPTMISASMLNSPLTHRFVTMNNPNSPFQKTIQVVHGGQGGTIIGPGMTLARPPVPGATGTYQTIRVQQGQAVMVNNTPITPTSTIMAPTTSTPAATTSTTPTTTTSVGVVLTGGGGTADVGGGGGVGGGD